MARQPRTKHRTAKAKKTGSARAPAGKPPAWNLADLYASVDDPAIERDLKAAVERAQKFNADHAGKLLTADDIDAGALAAALREYEDILEIASRVMSYANLLHAGDTADERHGMLLANVMQYGTQIQAQMMFFDLEWMDVADTLAERLLADDRLASRRHYLAVARRYRPYKLSEPQEQVVNQLANTGSRAWDRFFEEFTASLRFNVRIDGKTKRLGQAETLDLLYDPARKKRKAAADAMTAGLREHERTLGFIFNTLLWDHQIDDEMRSYPHPMAARNLDNLIDQESVDALLSAVDAGYPVVRRYYRLKGKLLKIKQLADYDRYAPLPGTTPRVNWNKARQTVLDAFGDFSPRMADVAGEFFDKSWIDAPVRPDKIGGAFSSPTVPSVHPYILMNFNGKMRDVMTLAHELGHGVHQHLAREQGLLQSSTPLTLAETASVFGEMLVFERVMAEQDDPRVKLSLLCGKIEDTFATVFRQTCMTRFEQAVHNARREQGELPIEQINRHWMQANKSMFGKVVNLSDGYGWWWSYIPHFIRTPFYCYAYSFGEMLVIALVRLYREQGAAFVPKYLALLEAGGSGTPDELLAPLGIDIREPTFWKKGVEFIDDMVKQAESLAAQCRPKRR